MFEVTAVKDQRQIAIGRFVLAGAARESNSGNAMETPAALRKDRRDTSSCLKRRCWNAWLRRA
ncbi:MAG: hypothetical protein ACKV2Q_20485 [Planctomycetaceae bacterium]